MIVLKRGFLAVMILLMLVAGKAFSDEGKGQVLVLVRGGMGWDTSPSEVDYAILKEFGVMKTTLEDAGFSVVVATIYGQPASGKTISIMPNRTFHEVNIGEYKGLLVPCLDASEYKDEAVQIVKDALALGIPIGAQNSGVSLLSIAGGLKGKSFAMAEYYVTGGGKKDFNAGGGKYLGDGVVQDGKIVTSGNCPIMARYVNKPDGTLELTKKVIALMQ